MSTNDVYERQAGGTKPDWGAWDASGNYIYLAELDPEEVIPRRLLVIDVQDGAVTATVDLDGIISSAGFNAGFVNPRNFSASYKASEYSFDPGNDRSLCLMMSATDWSTEPHPTYFTLIIDLPGLLGDTSGLICSLSITGIPIVDFLGTDFTTNDAGIVGQDHSKNRVRGVWIYDLGTGLRDKIIGDGGFPDWSI